MSDDKKQIYSDGAVEDRIIEYLQANNGKSEGIIDAIPDGVVFHNFTSARENLLNWYPFEPGCSVLEIGAGMGALTPYLASVCGKVTAIEPAPERAKICELRCSGLDNVRIIQSAIDAFSEENEKYDYALLVGVLEWAGVYGTGANPWLTMLSQAKEMLKPTGKLLIAIENKFGLKYWCGAPEDHTAVPFDSINDYAKSKDTERFAGTLGVRTFSKEELEKLLCTTGFLSNKFYYMLPDYKFPMCALSDDSEEADVIVDTLKCNYGDRSILIANEMNLLPQVARNGAMGFFANAFLVEACNQKATPCPVQTVTMKRDFKPDYRVSTMIGTDRVIRTAASQEACTHIANLIENARALNERGVPCLNQEPLGSKATQAERIKAPRADSIFLQAMEDRNTALVTQMLDMLSAYVKKSGDTIMHGGRLVLKEGYPDLTLRNSFWVNGDFLFFDQEWKAENVPVKYLMFRSLQYGAEAAPEEMKKLALDYCEVTEEEIREFTQWEQAFLTDLMDEENCRWFDPLMYRKDLELESVIEAKLRNKQAHIELLLQSERDLQHQNSLLASGKEELEKALAAEVQNKLNALGEVQQLRDKENRYLSELVADKDKIISTMEQVSRLTEEKRQTQAALDLITQEKQQTQDALAAMTQEKQQAQDALAAVTQEKQQAQDALAAVTQEKQETENALAAMTQQKNNTWGEVLQLRDKENRYLNEIAALKVEKDNTWGEVLQLRDKENRYINEYNAIMASRAWRFGRACSNVVRFFVPKGSKRAVFCKLLVTMVKHPKIFFSCLTPKKMKRFLQLMRYGNTQEVFAMIHKNVTGQVAPSDLEVVQPEIVPVELAPAQEKTTADYPVLQIPQWEVPLVSIVIPVYNQFEYTYRCVESILKNSGDITYEILIGNDCSTDLTTEIDNILPGVRCITNEKNLRFVLNCKAAAKHAVGKYLLFLNNDTQVQPNWLAPLVELIESADDIGMVGSKLVYPDGLLQEAGGILWRDGSAWNFGNRQNPSDPQFNYVKEADYISGAAIMLARSLWEEIGGFDETFVPAYCDDSDLAFTIRKKGYRVMYQPKSVVVHFEGVSNGTDTASGQKQYQIINSQKFFEKWKDVLKAHPENGQNVFQARDRSYNKKTLLMVDHYVPHYDKDAGSRTVFQYLKLFVKLGFNVKFIGDNFYQHEPYTTTLQQMGIEVLYGPDCANNWEQWIRENADQFDYAFLNRPHIAPRYLDALRRYTKAKIVYYGHDLAFLREMREYEVTGDGSFKESSLEWQPKELALMRQADMAYYPSYVEVDAVHAIDPEIRIKAIPAYLFENVKWEGYDFDSRKDIMFIGGFGHRPNVDAVKWLAKEILPELLEQLPDVKVHILGSNAPEEVLRLANDHLIIHGFVTDEELERFYRTSRISLVPLRYGAGIKGKVVEAMRFGTPVVTTSTGAEGIPNAEKAMLIEDDAKLLAQKLAKLYQDADALTSMSENCIAYIQDNYSPENAIQVIGPEFDLN